MSTYAIGDIQGCYSELMTLLDVIHFHPERDTLWFVGDLVNRGPGSLAVLRFIKSLPSKIVVLGNHDFYLIARSFGVAETIDPQDTVDDILQAPDKTALIDWLRKQPLIHYDPALQYVMVHAGIAPCWTLAQACAFAREVERVLQSDQCAFYIEQIYGDQPDQWRDDLQGVERLRVIASFFTRMRLCDAEGKLDFKYKGQIASKPAHLFPWFSMPNRIPISQKILFGHWSALGQQITVAPNIYALDTGCLWGGSLTAMRLEDGECFSVGCKK